VGKGNRYERLIEAVFLSHFRQGACEFEFDREEIVGAARRLGVRLPKNLGDVLYSFRYRVGLPESIRSKAPPGTEWVIEAAGRGRYRFRASTATARFAPNAQLAETKVPDATPGMIAKYALSDEQSLLASMRYNRLVDIFTRVTCYSLQNHLRTFVQGIGQVETDEIYVGVDRCGVHYVIQVQAKAGRDVLSAVQVQQDLALCRERFPGLVPRAVGAQLCGREVVAMFEFEADETGIRIREEKHYRLVPPNDLSAEDLARYRKVLEA